MTHHFFVFLSTERNQLNYIVVVLFWSQSKCTGYKTVDEPLRFYTQHSKKNESCVTQANTGYLEKAKFILARNGHSQTNTVVSVIAVSSL